MESKQYRGSISFEILANDSPGDGDSLVAVHGNTIGVEKAENAKSRRRRRKSRSSKSSLGDLSPVAPLGEDLPASFPASPLSSLEDRAPPLEDVEFQSFLPRLVKWRLLDRTVSFNTSILCTWTTGFHFLASQLLDLESWTFFTR